MMNTNARSPTGTPPARVYDAIGAWFAEKGDLKCAVAAFEHALRLEPHSAEAHFDLGLVRQRQEKPAAAANPPGAQPGTQPGASANPPAAPAPPSGQPAVSPTGTPKQSPPGSPLPVPGKTP